MSKGNREYLKIDLNPIHLTSHIYKRKLIQYMIFYAKCLVPQIFETLNNAFSEKPKILLPCLRSRII